jgi:hypothetical protein
MRLLRVTARFRHSLSLFAGEHVAPAGIGRDALEASSDPRNPLQNSSFEGKWRQQGGRNTLAFEHGHSRPGAETNMELGVIRQNPRMLAHARAAEQHIG